MQQRINLGFNKLRQSALVTTIFRQKELELSYQPKLTTLYLQLRCTLAGQTGLRFYSLMAVVQLLPIVN